MKSETKLVCRYFSEEIDDLVFYFYHETKFYGRCLIRKCKKIKKPKTCEICKEIITDKHNYYPKLWDRSLNNYAICSQCFWASVKKWVDEY